MQDWCLSWKAWMLLLIAALVGCDRQASRLAAEHGIAVRLWVDDLTSFNKICPQVEISQTQQIIAGVTIMLWSHNTDSQAGGIASVVVEALACNVPMAYQRLMAQQNVKPLWLNLEYLSAEAWVEGCHALPSPQPASTRSHTTTNSLTGYQVQTFAESQVPAQEQMLARS